jgi:hypothetical protein
MTCLGNLLVPSEQQFESRRVCELIVYLFKRISIHPPYWVIDAANECYGDVRRLDEATKILCEACRSLNEGQVNVFIYDGRNAGARRLADWWDRHQELDRRRVDEEEKSRNKILLRARAIRKLTVEERQAIGL